jgi:hypothetical protein
MSKPIIDTATYEVAKQYGVAVANLHLVEQSRDKTIEVATRRALVEKYHELLIMKVQECIKDQEDELDEQTSVFEKFGISF